MEQSELQKSIRNLGAKINRMWKKCPANQCTFYHGFIIIDSVDYELYDYPYDCIMYSKDMVYTVCDNPDGNGYSYGCENSFEIGEFEFRVMEKTKGFEQAYQEYLAWHDLENMMTPFQLAIWNHPDAVKGKEFAYVYDVESKNLKQVMVKGMKKRYISSFEKPIEELYKDEENKAMLSAYVRRLEIKNILS